MKARNSQSALLFMQDSPKSAPVRTWSIHVLPGMLAGRSQKRQFFSVEAFDGYVREIRASGYSVTFNSPHTATVEARQ